MWRGSCGCSHDTDFTCGTHAPSEYASSELEVSGSKGRCQLLPSVPSIAAEYSSASGRNAQPASNGRCLCATQERAERPGTYDAVLSQNVLIGLTAHRLYKESTGDVGRPGRALEQRSFMQRTPYLGWKIVDVGEVVAASADIRGPLLHGIKPSIKVGKPPAAAYLHALHATNRTHLPDGVMTRKG